MGKIIAIVVAFILMFTIGLTAGSQTRAASAEADCMNALAGVVEAVEAQWATASEAVDRAQAAVTQPEIRDCLEH